MLVFLILLVLARPAYAEDIYARKLNAYAHSLELFQFSQSLKEEHFYREDDLKARLHGQHLRLNAWLIAWSTSPSELHSNSLAQSFAAIDSFALKQYVEFTDIKEDANQIHLAIDQSIRRYNEQIDYPFPGFNKDYLSLKKHNEALIEYLENIKNSNKSFLSKLSKLEEALVEVFKRKLRQTFINENIHEITEALAGLDKILTKYRLLGSYLAKIEVTHSDFNKAFFELDYFAAEKKLRLLKDTVSDLKNALEQSGLEESLITKEEQGLSMLIRQSELNLDTLLNNYQGEISLVLAAFIDEKKLQVAPYCLERNEGRYNCELYSWLSRLQTQQITQMNEQELKSLDQAWKAVLNTGGAN